VSVNELMVLRGRGLGEVGERLDVQLYVMDAKVIEERNILICIGSSQRVDECVMQSRRDRLATSGRTKE